MKGKYDAYDGDMTFMGSVMAKLPIDFRLGRLIVLGHVLGCVDDAIVIGIKRTAYKILVNDLFFCLLKKSIVFQRLH